MAEGDRILSHLPAVFAGSDADRHLRDLACVLEALLFEDEGGDPPLPGYERQLQAIPALFAPLRPIEGLAEARTPDALLGWLAEWLGFTPHRLLPRERLRAVLAEIVRLNSRRGTRSYLEELLKLAFADEVVAVVVDDTRRPGLTISEDRPPRIGVDTRLGPTPPFVFDVAVTFAPSRVAAMTGDEALASRHRLHALIDYAKPAHTRYGLSCNLP